MLQQLLQMGQQGLTPHQMLASLKEMFGKPMFIGEVVAEYNCLRAGMLLFFSFYISLFLGNLELFRGLVLDGKANDAIGPKPNQWTPAMVVRLKELLARGMEVNDITTELFHEFAKPESGHWQETYRKIQEMRLEGEIE